MGLLILTVLTLAFVALGSFALIRTKFTFTLTLMLFPLVVGLLVFVVTESLSAFELISPAVMWVVVVVAVLLMGINHRKLLPGLYFLRADLDRQKIATRNEYMGLLRWQKWWFWPTLLISIATLLTTLFLALWGPPNNADSLRYHLPRIMYWLQNESVNHYATHDLAQVSVAPLSSYGLLWLHALSGVDLLLNINQWMAYAWITLIAGAVVRRTTGSRIAGLLGLFLVVAMPMAIAEATTTQSDLIGALWVVIAIGLLIERQKRELSFHMYAIGLLAASALAAATKTTALVSMVIVILGAAFAEIVVGRKKELPAGFGSPFGLAARVGLASLVGALMGLLPQAIRNQMTFGSIFGETFGLLTERQDLLVLVGNTLRIIVRNVGVPTVIGDHINMRLEGLFEYLRIPWIDPDAVGYGHLPFISLARNEDYATNPIHLVLGLIAALIALVWFRRAKELRLVAGLGVGMLLATALVWKWNEWGNRFLIQVMVAFALVLASLLWFMIISPRRYKRARQVGVGLFVVATALYGFAVSLTLQYRPILDSNSVLTMPRDLRYFYVGGQQQALDVQRLKVQIECAMEGDSVGIPPQVGVEEYFLWSFLNSEGVFRFVPIRVQNATKKYEVVDTDWILGVDQCRSGHES